jgi:hypothetical protein
MRHQLARMRSGSLHRGGWGTISAMECRCLRWSNNHGLGICYLAYNRHLYSVSYNYSLDMFAILRVQFNWWLVRCTCCFVKLLSTFLKMFSCCRTKTSYIYSKFSLQYHELLFNYSWMYNCVHFLGIFSYYVSIFFCILRKVVMMKLVSRPWDGP